MTKRPLRMRGGDVGTVSRTWLQSGPSDGVWGGNNSHGPSENGRD